jgi:hypothetical protein
MQTLVLLHILCVFVWLGSALFEIVAERASSNLIGSMLAALAQGRLDLIVETPAFLGVLLTGGYLASHAHPTPLLTLKIAAGLVSLGVSVYGLMLLRDRPVVASAGALVRRMASHRRLSSATLLGVGIALANGFHLFAQG